MFSRLHVSHVVTITIVGSVILPFSVLPFSLNAQGSAPNAPGGSSSPRLLGAYRFTNGDLAGVEPSSAGTWRYIDFRTGESHQLFLDDSLSFHSSSDFNGGEPKAITYRFTVGVAGQIDRLVMKRGSWRPMSAKRVVVREDTMSFSSGDVRLFAKLVRPVGRTRTAAVAFVHGSDTTGVVDSELLPYLLAANGISGFVFDKRGTGKSTGNYTQRFGALSDDVVAAVAVLRGKADIDSTRIGLAGFSQGGWVAPLAASKDPSIAFVLVGYGMAMSIADEDRLEGPLKLKAIGVDAEQIRRYEAANATLHALARDNFANWTDLERTLEAERNEPWVAAVRKTQTWMSSVLAMGIPQAKVVAPQMFTTYFDPFYDPVPTLESLHIPMLWLMAGDDIEAPPEITLGVLDRLRREGRLVETIVFPRTDHGIREFVIKDGRRVTTKYAAGYFTAMASWLSRQGKAPRKSNASVPVRRRAERM
ncbi:MAG: alpha/beta fold hydrolase [Gemmatimonadales bacterium]